MTDKTDALVAKLREANEHLIGAFEHHRAITEAIEALAAQPAETPDEARQDGYELGLMAQGGQPAEAVGYLSDWALLQLRSNGYVTASIYAHNKRIYGDGKPAHPIYTAPPAESVGVEAAAVPRNPSQDWLDKVANLLGIDSAEMDNIHAAILSATPQPAEGDGAVAWYVYADTEHWVTDDRDEADKNRSDGCHVRPLIFGDMTRPAATAVGA